MKQNHVNNFGVTVIKFCPIEYSRGKQISVQTLNLTNGYIEDIYFFAVITKYISSNVLKISAISRVRSKSEIADIFNT